jgi:hypothetical protein
MAGRYNSQYNMHDEQAYHRKFQLLLTNDNVQMPVHFHTAKLKTKTQQFTGQVGKRLVIISKTPALQGCKQPGHAASSISICILAV